VIVWSDEGLYDLVQGISNRYPAKAAALLDTLLKRNPALKISGAPLTLWRLAALRLQEKASEPPGSANKDGSDGARDTAQRHSRGTNA
jgi:hypothetical protein